MTMKHHSLIFTSAVLLATLVLFSGCGRQEVLTGNFSLVSPLPRMIVTDTTVSPIVVASSWKEPKIRTSVDTTLGEGLKEFQRQECYRIIVGKCGIEIKGGSELGVLHGIQTVKKALPLAEKGQKCRFALPAGEVFDYPEFPYRAFMLDCGRHFFPASYIKDLIDILAMHNINYFHWHLSEDQGWRLEIKKYPRLTEIGSYRPGTQRDDSPEMDGIPVSGFYTQEEAREIVRYAAERGITVIPEIDMPGHMQAALAAYPELGCTGGPYEVATRYGVLDDVLCVGKDASMQFAKDVLEEVMDIFPSSFIHLGGDECPKTSWENCPDCQRKIRELGIKASGSKTCEELLQSWFCSQMEEFLSMHGRRMICWNDVLCDWGDNVVGEPSRNTVIAAWMRPESAAIAAREGYDAIMCPVGHLYFSNMGINRLPLMEGIRKVYDLAVIPEGLTDGEKRHIIGAEACIWTERVAETDSLEWRLLPRLSTLAELQWSDPASRDFDAYLLRLRHMIGIYAASGWNFRDDI